MEAAYTQGTPPHTGQGPATEELGEERVAGARGVTHQSATPYSDATQVTPAALLHCCHFYTSH